MARGGAPESHAGRCGPSSGAVGRVDGRGTAHPVKEAARALRPDLVPGTRPGGLSGRRGRPAPTIARGKGGVKGSGGGPERDSAASGPGHGGQCNINVLPMRGQADFSPVLANCQPCTPIVVHCACRWTGWTGKNRGPHWEALQKNFSP
jgi:hypothetical protein